MADNEGIVPQVEEAEVIDLAALHAVFGCGDVDFGVQLRLADLTILASVPQQRADFDNLFDAEVGTVEASRLLALSQAGTSKGGIARGIAAHDITRRESHHNLATLYGFDEAETEFRLRQAMPALTGSEFHRMGNSCEPGNRRARRAIPRPGSLGKPGRVRTLGSADKPVPVLDSSSR